MRVTQSIKISSLFVYISLTACLIGCSHDNPLKTINSEASAEFLLQASKSAEKKLNLLGAKSGSYYQACMMGKERQALCDNLYQAMMDYAKTTTLFKVITVSDLENQMVFASLKNDYERLLFNSLD